MSPFITLPSRVLIAAACLLALATSPARTADDDPKGETVTVIKAAKSCFADIVEVSGFMLPREGAEIQVRPERLGLKVLDVMAEAGETVTAGQTLARLNLPEGGSINVTAPASGLIFEANATIGAMAGAKGEPLFKLLIRNEYDFVGQVPTIDLGKLSLNPPQPASVKVIGLGDIDGRVRRIGPVVQADQQGTVFIAVNPPANRRLPINASGRALIKTGQSCGIAVPATAVQYGSAGTVVQLVKRQRVETKRVEVGLMSGGQIEIRDGINEGDDVVARAGALLREGDPVRPATPTPVANAK